MSDPESQKRYTVRTFLGMVLGTLLAVAIGFGGFSLWFANMVTFAPAMDGETDNQLTAIIFYFLMAGPFVAGAGIILGWLAFIVRATGLGVKLVVFLPLIWVILMVIYFTVIMQFCDGDFTCGVVL